MADPWTIDKVLALAPDASAAQAGRQLAAPGKWAGLGRNQQVLWGQCQGSGKDPYRVQVDLGEPVFKCSCPSRKFPCKHGLGLFLLLAQSPQVIPVGEVAAWVAEWLEARAKRAGQKQKKQVPAAAADAGPVDPQAAAKRVADRQRRVAAGLAELEVWLKDLVRHGLAAAQVQPYAFWEQPAARMVDAQAPGVARIVRDLGSIASSGEGWQDRLLHRLAQLHLLLEGYKRIDVLPPAVQADIRALIGWTMDQDELLAQAGVRDTWCILGQRVELEDKLRVQRTWLRGRTTGRPALVLQFAHGRAAFEGSLLPGTELDAELVFYPGASMRALLKDRSGAVESLTRMPGHRTVLEAVNEYAAVLASFPWLEFYPMALAAIVPVRLGEDWALRDEAGDLLPLAGGFARGWDLLAMSGGHSIGLCGEWDGQALQPLGAMDQDGYVWFKGGTDGSRD